MPAGPLRSGLRGPPSAKGSRARVGPSTMLLPGTRPTSRRQRARSSGVGHRLASGRTRRGPSRAPAPHRQAFRPRAAGSLHSKEAGPWPRSYSTHAVGEAPPSDGATFPRQHVVPAEAADAVPAAARSPSSSARRRLRPPPGRFLAMIQAIASHQRAVADRPSSSAQGRGRRPGGLPPRRRESRRLASPAPGSRPPRRTAWPASRRVAQLLGHLEGLGPARSPRDRWTARRTAGLMFAQASQTNLGSGMGSGPAGIPGHGPAGASSDLR